MSLHLLLILIKYLIIKAAYRYPQVQELGLNSHLNLRRTNMIYKILEGEAKFKWRQIKWLLMVMGFMVEQ